MSTSNGKKVGRQKMLASAGTGALVASFVASHAGMMNYNRQAIRRVVDPKAMDPSSAIFRKMDGPQVGTAIGAGLFAGLVVHLFNRGAKTTDQVIGRTGLGLGLLALASVTAASLRNRYDIEHPEGTVFDRIEYLNERVGDLEAKTGGPDLSGDLYLPSPKEAKAEAAKAAEKAS